MELGSFKWHIATPTEKRKFLVKEYFPELIKKLNLDDKDSKSDTDIFLLKLIKIHSSALEMFDKLQIKTNEEQKMFMREYKNAMKKYLYDTK